MGRLEGKVAIVTGSAVGIGRAIATLFGKEGARVVVNYSRSEAEAQETAEMVRKAGGEVLVIQADVSKDDQVRQMMARVLDQWGRIDILVNNAAITAHVPFHDLEALTDNVWDSMYDVNVKGTFYCCRAVVETMREQGQGRIINLGSSAGVWTRGSSIAYCASKAALIHLSRCLAKTLGPEIRLNVIIPGYVEDTRWNEGLSGVEEAKQKSAKESPLKRVGNPQDIAEVALFLATGGDFMTGTLITVDGGRMLA